MGFESLRDQPLHLILTFGPLQPGDLELFFGQAQFIDDGQTRTLHFHHDHALTWPELGQFLAWFPSRSQAAKNGWVGEIPKGYSEHRKRLVTLFILNLL